MSAKGSYYPRNYSRLWEAGALTFLQTIAHGVLLHTFHNKCAVQPGRAQASSEEENDSPSLFPKSAQSAEANGYQIQALS